MYIDGLDIRSPRCPVTAAVLNKFRHMANELKTNKISISAAKLKAIIGTHKSWGKIRLVLNELTEKGFIKSKLMGREYEYTINIDKINYINSPEVVKKDSASLAKIFKNYRKYMTGTVANEETISLWEHQLASILIEGRPAEAIKHIIAFLIHIEDDTITSPEQIGDTYHIHYAMAYSHLSSSKSKRALYKAQHYIVEKKAIHKPAKSRINNKKQKPTALLSDKAKWDMITDWLKKNGTLLWNLYNSQNYATNIEFDDYKSQASIFCFELINDKNMLPSEALFSSGVFFKLRTYMDLMRPKNRSGKKFEKLEEAFLNASASGLYTPEELADMKYELKNIDKNIITTTFADLEVTSTGERYDFIEQYIAQNDEDNCGTYPDHLRGDILSRLNELKKDCYYLYQAVCHIHGFDCEQLSYRELAKKYEMSYSTIYGHVQFVLKCFRDNKEIKINEAMQRANEIILGLPPP